MKFRISSLVSSVLPLLVAPLVLAGSALANDELTQVFQGLESESGPQMTKVRLLTDNMDSWYARWYAIDNAQESIDVTYYIVEPDIFGKSMLGLLYKKAKDGVKVRLMVDARGTKNLVHRFFGQRFLQALAALPNAEVKVFSPFHKALLGVPKNIRSGIASNHDKIVIADSKLAVTGGRNISMNYFVDPADYPGCYRDTDVLIEGDGIGEQMTMAFDEEFQAVDNYEVSDGWLAKWRDSDFDIALARRVMQRWMSGGGLYEADGLDNADTLREFNEEVSRYTKLVGYTHFARDIWQGRRAFDTRILDKHSFHGVRNDITPGMIALFDAAEEKIIIQNPYVIITQEVMAALKRASERGVELVLHTNSPASTDSLITQGFFIRDWWKLLRDLPTLRIFVFKDKRKLHTKAFVIDDLVTSIGTYNMDPMSQGINSEVMAVVHSETFAKRHRLRIEADIADSVEYLIRTDANGVVEKISGPGQHLEGKKGFLIQLLSKFQFLRPIV